MKIVFSAIILSVVAASLISCNGGSFTAIPAVDPPTPTAAPTANRWEVVALTSAECPAPDAGWKIVRLNAMLENRTHAYSPPTIRLTDAKLYTDSAHYYPMDIFRTSGTKVDKTTDLIFQRLLPNGFRVIGEYQNDAVVSYYLQAQIPQAAKPQFIRSPSYGGDIKVITSTTYPVVDSTADIVHSLDTQVILSPKIRLTADSLTKRTVVLFCGKIFSKNPGKTHFGFSKKTDFRDL